MIYPEESGVREEPEEFDAPESLEHDDEDPTTGGYSIDASVDDFPEEHENDMDDDLDDRVDTIKARKKHRPNRSGFFGI